MSYRRRPALGERLRAVRAPQRHEEDLPIPFAVDAAFDEKQQVINRRAD
jgi:hypothetical protein